MSEREIKLKVIEKADEIAKAVASGKDIYITKSANGIVVRKMTVQKVWWYVFKGMAYKRKEKRIRSF